MQGVYRRLPENIRLLMAKYDIDPAEVAAALNIAKALRTDPATMMYGEIVPVDVSGITISA
jgi:hypothetical protein